VRAEPAVVAEGRGSRGGVLLGSERPRQPSRVDVGGAQTSGNHIEEGAAQVRLEVIDSADAQSFGEAQAFFRCWTRKEAYIKAIGEGLSMPLHQFDVSIRPNENANALLATRPDPTEAGRWMVCDVSFHLEYAAAIAVELKAGI